MLIRRTWSWDRQPGQHANQIDWSNPLTNGLVLAVSGTHERNIVNKGALIGGTNGKTVGRCGLKLETSSSTNLTYTPPSALSEATILVVGASDQSIKSGPWKTNDTAADWVVYNGAIYLNTFASTRYIIAYPFPSADSQDGYVLCCRGSSVANSHAAFLNGKLIGSTNSPFVCNSSIILGSNGSINGHAAYLYLLFDRALSDGEIKSLSANPWQIFAPERRTLFVPSGAGGTSSITSDASASYLIRNAISQDLASAFGIRGAVQADRASSYALRGAAQSNLSGAYSLRGSAFKDATAAYSIRGMVQSDEVASYNLRGSVQSSESASYAIRGAVSSDRSATYDILRASAVSSSLDASFAVRGAVPSDQAASFVVRGAAQSNQVVSYSIRGLVQSSLSAGYSIDAGVSAVSSDLLVSYFVDGAAAQWPTAEQNAAAVVAALPSVADIAAAVLAMAQITPIHSDMKKTNGQAIIGDGSEGNRFRSHLVP